MELLPYQEHGQLNRPAHSSSRTENIDGDLTKVPKVINDGEKELGNASQSYEKCCCSYKFTEV